MSKFTVDTHLFRELGELLVGRDSTALVELIKNAYDADATRVVVVGDQLSSTLNGSIRVIDNGVGMSRDEFEEGFLRIASRSREAGTRRSKRFGRRYTGAKGIGRLAAHKLARKINIVSFPWQKTLAQSGVEATIDWDEIENHTTLDDLEGTTSVLVDDLPARSSFGTTITLSSIRRRWTAAERARFINEIQTFSAPDILVRPIKASPFPTLFTEPTVRDTGPSADQSSFSVKLEGDFAPGDEYWSAVLNAADWVIEIDALTSKSKVKYQTTPTAKTVRTNRDLEPISATVEHPDPGSGPFFQARILVREGLMAGAVASKDAREWIAGFSGIKVFLEGFRVLPYGEKGNDWLSIDLDYSARSRKLPWVEELDTELPADADAGLLVLPNRHYFGAVFLTQSNTPALKMLVNREGFLPDASYDTLVRLVRQGVDLNTRARAAARQEDRRQRREQRVESAASRGAKSVPFESLKRASSVLHTARQLLTKGDYAGAKRTIDSGAADLDSLALDSDRVVSEVAMLRVLASVGTQMAAFIHELNSLLGAAEGIQKSLERVRGDVSLPKHLRQELSALAKNLSDLRRSLERHASYLVDVVTPDARRRRTRQSLADRFEAALRLIADAAEKKHITITNNLSPDIKSPPMFPAELTTVFSNLLTNAVKATEDGGAIRVTGKMLSDRRTRVMIENTGSAVRLKDGERWFRPFESTTVILDPVLGQGMGLGLPITRNMLEQYGAEIRFVEPSKGFATALEILFPNA